MSKEPIQAPRYGKLLEGTEEERDMITRCRRAPIFLTIAILAITIIVMYIIAEPATIYDLGKNTVHFALGR